MPLFGPNIEKLEAKRDVAGLMRALGDKGSAGFNATRALARLGAPSEPLIALLADENVHAARNAEYALVALGRSAIPALAAALGDDRSKVRRGVVRILGAIGGDATVEPLAFALRDQDAIVHDQAVELLGNLGAIRVGVALSHRDDDLRLFALAAITPSAERVEAARARKAADEAKAGYGQFLQTPCDLSRHEWRIYSEAGLRYRADLSQRCLRCPAYLDAETGTVYAPVKDGSVTGRNVVIGKMEHVDGKWRPVRGLP